MCLVVDSFSVIVANGNVKTNNIPDTDYPCLHFRIFFNYIYSVTCYKLRGITYPLININCLGFVVLVKAAFEHFVPFLIRIFRIGILINISIFNCCKFFIPPNILNGLIA